MKTLPASRESSSERYFYERLVKLTRTKQCSSLEPGKGEINVPPVMLRWLASHFFLSLSLYRSPPTKPERDFPIFRESSEIRLFLVSFFFFSQSQLTNYRWTSERKKQPSRRSLFSNLHLLPGERGWKMVDRFGLRRFNDQHPTLLRRAEIESSKTK